MSEQGYPEIEGEGWFAFMTPAGTPRDIIDLLYRDISEALASPDLKDKLAALGFTPIAKSPEQSAAIFRSESDKWSKVIRAANIRAE